MVFHRLQRRLSDRNYGCRLRPKYLIFSQFSIIIIKLLLPKCFASGALPGPRWGAYDTPDPSRKTLGHTLAEGPTEWRGPGPRDPTICHWDDTNLFYSSKDIKEVCSVVSVELDKLCKWFSSEQTSLPCYLVPSSHIRPLATAVAAPLHPALSLASRLMLLMIAPLEYPLSVSSHLCLVLVFLVFSLHSFSRASRHLPSLLLSPCAQSSLMQPLVPMTPVSIPV